VAGALVNPGRFWENEIELTAEVTAAHCGVMKCQSKEREEIGFENLRRKNTFNSLHHLNHQEAKHRFGLTENRKNTVHLLMVLNILLMA
jgi:hypothetical protein